MNIMCLLGNPYEIHRTSAGNPQKSHTPPYFRKNELIKFRIICYWLSLPPISPTHRGHCLGKACVYREPRRQRLLHGPVVWARAPRYSLLLFHKGIAAGPRAEPLLLLHKGIATRPRAEPIGNRIGNLINKNMCFQMYQGGVGFPLISYGQSFECIRIFYRLST